MTIPYDDVLREQIRDHLAGHDRRSVADATKRHAAVAVVLVDSEVGEDRIDPAPVDRPGDIITVSQGTFPVTETKHCELSERLRQRHR